MQIRYTSDYLLKLRSLFTVPSIFILVTVHVDSPPTNMDHEEGIDSYYTCVETRDNKNCSIKHFKELHSVKIFWLCNAFHLQKKGTAMGTPMVANHANVSMNMFKRSLLNDLLKKL